MIRRIGPSTLLGVDLDTGRHTSAGASCFLPGQNVFGPCTPFRRALTVPDWESRAGGGRLTRRHAEGALRRLDGLFDFALWGSSRSSLAHTLPGPSAPGVNRGRTRACGPGDRGPPEIKHCASSRGGCGGLGREDRRGTCRGTRPPRDSARKTDRRRGGEAEKENRRGARGASGVRCVKGRLPTGRHRDCRRRSPAS